jgi:small subunit ribosomal protein S4
VIKSVISSIDLALNFAWLTVDRNELSITFDRIPQREELDPEFKEQLVIEYYSR